MSLVGRGGALAFWLVAATAAAQEQIEKIVVLPFNVASGVDEKKKALLNEVLLSELSTVVPSSIEVFGAADVEAMIGLVETRSTLGCDDTQCLVEIGQALGASHLIVPALGVLGGQFVINFKFINVKNARVLFRKVFYVDADERALLAGIQQMVQELAAAQGWIEGVETSANFSQSAAAPAPRAAGQEGAALPLWGGAALAGAGVIGAVGFGFGTLYSYSEVTRDTISARDLRNAGWLGLGMSGGTALSVLAAAGGATLVALSLSGEVSE